MADSPNNQQTDANMLKRVGLWRIMIIPSSTKDDSAHTIRCGLSRVVEQAERQLKFMLWPIAGLVNCKATQLSQLDESSDIAFSWDSRSFTFSNGTMFAPSLGEESGLG